MVTKKQAIDLYHDIAPLAFNMLGVGSILPFSIPEDYYTDPEDASSLFVMLGMHKVSIADTYYAPKGEPFPIHVDRNREKAKGIFFNPFYLPTLDMDELAVVLLHEIAHGVHVFEVGHQDAWAITADMFHPACARQFFVSRNPDPYKHALDPYDEEPFKPATVDLFPVPVPFI